MLVCNQKFDALTSNVHPVSSKYRMLTIVIPCFNEFENLPGLIEICSKVSEQREISFILVNNGSTDQSGEILSKSNHPGISIVDLKVNEGYGNGLWEGIKAAKTELIGWLHADQADLLNSLDIPEDLIINPEMFHKGVRLNRSLKERFISRNMELACSFILRIKMRDINAQPNIYPKSLLKTIELPPRDFSFDMFVYAKALKSGLYENRFKVIAPRRIKGSSSWNTGFTSIIRMSLRTISAAHKFRSSK